MRAVPANTGAGDLDMALTGNGHFLYVFVHGSNAIEGFTVNHDGAYIWKPLLPEWQEPPTD